jgi:hypothetical protein
LTDTGKIISLERVKSTYDYLATETIAEKIIDVTAEADAPTEGISSAIEEEMETHGL